MTTMRRTVHAYDDNGRPICGAKTRKGLPCRVAPMPNGRCYRHGGASHPGGSSHPGFRTGRYAKLPARMIDRFLASLDDPDLLAVREDIAANDARIADLVARLDTGESGSLWRQLRDAQAEVDAARGGDDPAALAEAMQRVRALILRGHADHAAWAELREAQEHGRKLRESERKRLVEMHQMIAADKALAWGRALMEAVERRVTDRKVLTAISRDVMQIMNNPGEG